MRRLLFLGLVLLGLPSLATAGVDSKQLAKKVAPFLDDRAFCVVHVDLKLASPEVLAQRLSALTNQENAKKLATAEPFSSMHKLLMDHKAEHLVVVLSLADVPAHPPVLLLPFVPADQFKSLTEKIEQTRMFPDVRFNYIDGTLVMARKPVAQRLQGMKPVPQPHLVAALDGAGDGAVRVVFLATADMRRILEEVMPQLPEEVGGGSIKTLSRGLDWASIGLDLAKGTRLSLTLESPNEPAAKKLQSLMEQAIALLRKNEDLLDEVPGSKALLPKLKPTREGTALRVTLEQDTLVAFTKPMFIAADGAAQRQRHMNNLKQVGLAMHNYHDVKRQFPANTTTDKDGKPLLSWRVHILPYIEAKELYEQFKLDEPWDSEHNKKLIAKMPQVYAPPNEKLAAMHKTTLLAPVGEGTIFPPKKALEITAITDGTSNTIFVIDANDEQAVVWTKPDDWKFDAKNPMKGLVGHYPKGFLALFADGSVHFIAKTIDAKTLRALFTRSGGEVVNLD